MKFNSEEQSAASLDIYPNSLCKYYRQQVFYMYVEIGRYIPEAVNLISWAKANKRMYVGIWISVRFIDHLCLHLLRVGCGIKNVEQVNSKAHRNPRHVSLYSQFNYTIPRAAGCLQSAPFSAIPSFPTSRQSSPIQLHRIPISRECIKTLNRYSVLPRFFLLAVHFVR